MRGHSGGSGVRGRAHFHGHEGGDGRPLHRLLLEPLLLTAQVIRGDFERTAFVVPPLQVTLLLQGRHVFVYGG